MGTGGEDRSERRRRGHTKKSPTLQTNNLVSNNIPTALCISPGKVHPIPPEQNYVHRGIISCFLPFDNEQLVGVSFDFLTLVPQHVVRLHFVYVHPAPLFFVAPYSVSMGASSSSAAASKNPAWYPGEPSVEALLSEYENSYDGEEDNNTASLQPPLLKDGGGGDSELSSTTQQAKQTEALAPATTARATLASPSPPPPTAAATRASTKPQPGAKGGGVDNGSSLAVPQRTNNDKTAGSKASPRKRVQRDITTLPVVELSGMKVGGLDDFRYTFH